MFDIKTAGNALKYILSQSKGGDRKIFLLAGASIHSFAPGPPKALGGPVDITENVEVKEAVRQRTIYVPNYVVLQQMKYKDRGINCNKNWKTISKC